MERSNKTWLLLALATVLFIAFASAANLLPSARWDPTASASVANNGTGPTGTGPSGTGPTGGTGPVDEDPPGGDTDEGIASSGGGVISPAGIPARVMCAWELPDMRSDEPGIQYQAQPGALGHDDDVSQVPDRDDDGSNGTQYPCLGPENSDFPNQPSGVHRMIQVLPNPEDDPEEVRVQLWSLLDHPAGIGAIDDVYWKIFHPDGSFKTQVHAGPADNGGIVRARSGDISDCTEWGNYDVDDSMLHAASHSGQVSPSAIDDINNGLISLCQQQIVALYYAEFEISKHQPCGEYRIETHAVSDGTETVLSTYIDVLCFFDLQIDFGHIDWGPIQPGVEKVIAGDLDMATMGRPTVKNRGNHGMFVGVRFSEMVQQVESGGGKIIDLFDASFGKSPSSLVHLEPLPASELVWFDDDPSTNENLPLSGPGQVLCSNDLGKLDLSIHPAQTLPAGIYTGTVAILAKTAHGYCGTDQEQHDD